jgi:hypothetical protein
MMITYDSIFLKLDNYSIEVKSNNKNVVWFLNENFHRTNAHDCELSKDYSLTDIKKP